MSFPAIDLSGSPFARGKAQAGQSPDSVPAVRALVASRLAVIPQQPHVRRFLVAQWDFAQSEDAEFLSEMQGIAAGYGLDAHDLFAFLHAGQLGGLPDDGCSSWAYSGAMLVKNRDLRGPALPLQRVFRHIDPAWNGRSMLVVGSLGAPGAYSSGINSDGFALVDTQVVTRDQGVGLLRYFLMTRLLARCANVDDAIDLIRATPHAGGGTLVLADASGAIASVEIGHSKLGIDVRWDGWVARTNHFLTPGMAERLLAQPGDAGIDGSHARLALLTGWLEGRPTPSLGHAKAIMASHDVPGRTGLCRHGAAGGSTTVSTSLYDCSARTLEFVHGNPCHGGWTRYEL